MESNCCCTRSLMKFGFLHAHESVSGSGGMAPLIHNLGRKRLVAALSRRPWFNPWSVCVICSGSVILGQVFLQCFRFYIIIPFIHHQPSRRPWFNPWPVCVICSGSEILGQVFFQCFRFLYHYSIYPPSTFAEALVQSLTSLCHM